MSVESNTLLIGDIGGTNARFALVDRGVPGYRDEQVLRCESFASAEAAISHYLESVNAVSPGVICLAAAGPVLDGAVDMTNNHWHLRETSLQHSFQVEEARLLNDFEAIAHSLPSLQGDDADVIGLAPAADFNRDFTLGVVGPGTGLGAAGLIQRGGRTTALINEAGHVGFAPENALQRAVWEILRHRFGRVSDERLVSGQGVENIFAALAEIHDQAVNTLSAAEIFAHVADNQLAAESVNLFFEILGQIAGNFALSLGAYEGIYIAGGIVRRYPELLANSGFRASFENKGRHRHLMERIPTLLIRHSHPGLLGASVVALGQ